MITGSEIFTFLCDMLQILNQFSEKIVTSWGLCPQNGVGWPDGDIASYLRTENLLRLN